MAETFSYPVYVQLREIERKDEGRSVPIRCSKKIERTIEVCLMLMLSSIAGVSNFASELPLTDRCVSRIFIYGPIVLDRFRGIYSRIPFADV